MSTNTGPETTRQRKIEALELYGLGEEWAELVEGDTKMEIALSAKRLAARASSEAAPDDPGELAAKYGRRRNRQ